MTINGRLFYGDNLDVLRQYRSATSPTRACNLVYLDPPFNSQRDYNVLFQTKSGDEAQAQIEAFSDTWEWTHSRGAVRRRSSRERRHPSQGGGGH